jgi:hypothetical protein
MRHVFVRMRHVIQLIAAGAYERAAIPRRNAQSYEAGSASGSFACHRAASLRRTRPMQNLASRSPGGTMHVPLTEIAPVQQLDDALRPAVGVGSVPRGHPDPDLFELGVGEGDRRHVWNPLGMLTSTRQR